MDWFTLTLVYVFFLTAASVINKKSLNTEKLDAIVFVLLFKFLQVS
ncbi:hypothetical protein IT418_02315 [bacterium]|nr:hypothetical protein [bacterium]